MRKRKKGLPFIVIGLLLVVAALSLSIYNMWDDNRATESVSRVMRVIDVEIPAPDSVELPSGMIPDYQIAPKMEMPTITVDGNEYIGYLDFPTLDLNLPVQSDWSYALLRTSPCRFSGSVYENDMVIAAHNYRQHFGPLTRLNVGDTVSFVDVDGNEFLYTVGELEELRPDAAEDMTESDWDLTLFTCNADGRLRFTVRCARVED